MTGFDLPSVQAMVRRYATLQGLAATGWTFTCEIVPGLMHEGEPAWATVESNPATKTARVKVRDLVATPIPGVEDPAHELEVTISHELWHPWVTLLLADPSVANEELLVEAAAQAVVNSRGAAARIMARSIQAIPSAVRARVGTRAIKTFKMVAPTRARGGSSMAMNVDTVKKLLDAIESGDAAGMAEVCKQLVAEAASGGDAAAPAAVEPDGDENMGAAAREEGADMDPTKKTGAVPPAARPMGRTAIDLETTRARKASDALNRSAIRARIHEVRNVEGVELSPDLEKLILAETDIDGAEKLLKVAALSRPSGTRARGANPTAPTGTPPPAAAPIDVAALTASGVNPAMAAHIADLHAHGDTAGADLALRAARARIATAGSPWPTAAKQNGGAS